LQTDEFRNVTGILGLRYNAGREFSPANFVIFRHMPLYDQPVGMSDFRAVYSRYWMLDTALKLRAIGLEKRTYPMAIGQWKMASDQPGLEGALAKLKWQNWVSIPESARIQVLDLAGKGDEVVEGQPAVAARSPTGSPRVANEESAACAGGVSSSAECQDGVVVARRCCQCRDGDLTAGCGVFELVGDLDDDHYRATYGQRVLREGLDAVVRQGHLYGPSPKPGRARGHSRFGFGAGAERRVVGPTLLGGLALGLDGGPGRGQGCPVVPGEARVEALLPERLDRQRLRPGYADVGSGGFMRRGDGEWDAQRSGSLLPDGRGDEMSEVDAASGEAGSTSLRVGRHRDARIDARAQMGSASSLSVSSPRSDVSASCCRCRISSTHGSALSSTS